MFPEDWDLSETYQHIPFPELSPLTEAFLEWCKNHHRDMEYLHKGYYSIEKEDIIYKKYTFQPTNWQDYQRRHSDYWPEDYPSVCALKF